MYVLTRNATIVMWIFDHLGLMVGLFFGLIALIGIFWSVFSSEPHRGPLSIHEQEIIRSRLESEEGANSKQKISSNSTPTPVVLDKGEQGEALVLEAVQKSYPDIKTVSSVYIPIYDDKYTEVDLIAIHPTGLYVIESKNYRGVIVGEEDERSWNQVFIGARNEFYNPIMQNMGHIRAIQQFLGGKYNAIPCYSIIVFNNDSNIDMIKVKSKGIIITKHKDLVSQLQGLFHILPDVLEPESMIEVYEILRPQIEVSKEVKREHLEFVQHRKDNI